MLFSRLLSAGGGVVFQWYIVEYMSGLLESAREEGVVAVFMMRMIKQVTFWCYDQLRRCRRRVVATVGILLVTENLHRFYAR